MLETSLEEWGAELEETAAEARVLEEMLAAAAAEVSVTLSVKEVRAALQKAPVVLLNCFEAAG